MDFMLHLYFANTNQGGVIYLNVWKWVLFHETSKEAGIIYQKNKMSVFGIKYFVQLLAFIYNF